MTVARHALALDIGGTKIAAAIVDEHGVPRRVATAATNATEGAEQALERAVMLADSVLAGAAGEVIGAGVSTMGITRGDGVLLAPNVPGWDRLRIPARLRGAFGGLPVTVINDVKAATLAELTWGSLAGVGTGLYINLGTGVAAGLVVGGQLVDGANGAAGEFGYMATSIPGRRAVGTGQIEQLIGGLGAAERATAELGRPITAQQLFASASPAPAPAPAETIMVNGSLTTQESGERPIQHDQPDRPGCGDGDDPARVLDRLLDDIGLWAANVAVVLDPEVLALGGGFMRTPGPVLERVRRVAGLVMPFPPQIVAARYGADAALAGAGAAALAAARESGA